MKYRKFFYSLIAFISIFFLLSFSKIDNSSLSIKIETLSTVIKTILDNYVINISIDVIIDNAIDGIISKLDPYSRLIDKDEVKDLRHFRDGSYRGFGFTAFKIDSFFVIFDVNENSQIFKSGLRRGDKLIKIDTIDLINKSDDFLNNVINKDYAKFVIKREGLDTFITIYSQKSNFENNSLQIQTLIDNDIAYFKISEFDSQTPREVRSALSNLKRQIKLSAIIIDLAGNPGGLIYSAAETAEIFLPYNSLIYSTKGRNSNFDFEYVSKSQPIDVQTPLIVIIDSNTASASELFAAAIQDNDRGVVIGDQSFGKGLVQNEFQLPDGSSLLLSISKYYTPSGRTLQNLFLDNDNIRRVSIKADTTVSYSKKGRKLYHSIGITPDLTVSKNNYSEIVKDLVEKLLIFDFATYYINRHKIELSRFSLNDKLFDEFIQYLKMRNYFSESTMIEPLKKNSKIYKKISGKVSELVKIIKKEEENEIIKNKSTIMLLIQKEIIQRFYPQSYYKYIDLQKINNPLKEAIILVRENKYQKILNFQ